MKKINQEMVKVRLNFCPACGREAYRLTPEIVTTDMRPKICEKCGTSHDVMQRVSFCPFCTDPVVNWSSHYPYSCDAYNLQHLDIQDGQDMTQFVRDIDGDLWRIEFYMNYEVQDSSKPTPATMDEMRKAVNEAIAERRKEMEKIWSSALALGLQARWDDEHEK